ncbi:hypothetical protein T484DRAFT_1754798 [Baffinella frigidus]|nr:hypothetical protein T484DRAFT_1754798 [Cryptophyta sp. CCMP2293]
MCITTLISTVSQVRCVNTTRRRSDHTMKKKITRKTKGNAQSVPQKMVAPEQKMVAPEQKMVAPEVVSPPDNVDAAKLQATLRCFYPGAPGEDDWSSDLYRLVVFGCDVDLVDSGEFEQITVVSSRGETLMAVTPLQWPPSEADEESINVEILAMACVKSVDASVATYHDEERTRMGLWEASRFQRSQPSRFQGSQPSRFQGSQPSVRAFTAISKHYVSHVEILFEDEMAASIFADDTVFFRQRSYSNPYYRIKAFTVSPASYWFMYNFAKRSAEMQLGFSNTKMFCGLLIGYSGSSDKTFCSEFVTHTLQVGGSRLR